MKQIEVVAAVIRKGGRIFATQRGYGNYKDSWEFPGVIHKKYRPFRVLEAYKQRR